MAKKSTTRSKAKSVLDELRSNENPEKAAFFPRFFKSGPGEYGEGDKFIGVVVPVQRKIARAHADLSLPEILKLLKSPWHEARLTALFILVRQFERAKHEADQSEIVDFYIDNLDFVNNWDLVDSSAHKILGPYLLERERKIIHQLASSGHLWRERVAVITTLHFIKNDDFDDTLLLCEKFLDHPHDLIHKATGWMLREVGKKNTNLLRGFIRTNIQEMPRTMLRYSIEKLSKAERTRILNGKV